MGIALLLVACIISSPSIAEDDVHGVLSIAKMAGACGIMDSMIQLQATTKMPGGDEFVTRFWSVEAARLGMTVEQLSKTCSDSIIAYDKLWNVAAK